MKYLKLYEAIDSSVITKLNKYLNNKFNINDSFITSLKSICTKLDYPFSSINDDQIEYINARKGAHINVPENYDFFQENLTYAIKFWFSVENGFLGFTGSPYKPEKYISDKCFNGEEMDYLKRTTKYQGSLVPASDNYEELKTGDKVIAYLRSDRSFKNLVYGTIFRRPNNALYLIHNNENFSGGEPGGTDWKTFGDHSWGIRGKNSINTDHKKLNLLIPDLPSKSDYCVVFYLDKFMRSTTKLSDIKTHRKNQKMGASKLITNDEIQQLNIKRYTLEILHRLGLTLDKDPEFTKLENLLKLSTSYKFTLYSLSLNSYLTNLITAIYELMKYKNIDSFKKVEHYYDAIKLSSNKIKNSIIEHENYVFNNKNIHPGIKEFYTIVKEINDIIKEYINKLSIDNLITFRSEYYKLLYIKDLIEDNIIGSESVTRLLKYYNAGLASALNLSDENIQDSIKRIKSIKKEIQTVFK